MKIHFSNVNFSSNSGPNSFAHRLASQLTIMGHDIVGSKDLYESMLIFIEPSTTPRPEARVVQRLDGIWFKPEQFYSHNKLIKWTYDRSDKIIWQSEFDKRMTNYHWGYRPGKVIHNGIRIDKKKITNENILGLKKKYEKIFVSSASWHRQKRLKENTELFLKIKQNNPNSCFLVLGNNPDYKVDHEDIFYTGNINHESCLEIYSAADWMIHLAWLDHCPNVVVEAISQDCPVICSSSGGTKEIVKKNGVILQDHIEYDYGLTDYDSPTPIYFDDFILPEKISIEKEYLCIDSVADKYISLMEEI